MVPPVSVAAMAFKKAMSTDMTGVIVVPLWRHGRFWPSLMPDGRHAAVGIRAMKHIATKMKYPDEARKTPLLADIFTSYLALHFVGGAGLKWEPQANIQFCVSTLLGGHCKNCREAN